MMGAQQKLTSSYGINDHIHVHTILRSHRCMVHTRAQWTSSRSHVSIFLPSSFFSAGCPSSPVNVRAESEEPVLQSGARRRWQRRDADVDPSRGRHWSIGLWRCQWVMKDGVHVHCIQCTINVLVCHGREWWRHRPEANFCAKHSCKLSDMYVPYE